jgi:hypothetical protein
MKRKIVLRGYTDPGKEERWLNEMAAKGLACVAWWFPLVYVFERAEPGAWTYRSGVFPLGDREQYLALMADAGIETVATWINGAATFRKRTAGGPFELYSDTESRIALLQSWRKRFYLAITLLILTFVPYNYVASRELSLLELLPLLLVQLAGMTFVTVQTMRVTRQIRALEVERRITE